ncbi:MAG: sigma-70 family RNA polymerase sigma factor [Phycisphaerales bacterium]|nr:sigma-70 family RNA polymerase sigma factor [Phycisphaerales bacterium]
MHADRPFILTRIAAGDSSAVAACIDEYGGMVAALAARYLRQLGLDQDDAVQEIFVEVWKHAGRYDPALGSEASFIATIAHRRLIDRQRRHSSHPSVVSTTLPMDGTERQLQGAAPGPSQLELTREASEAFEQLTPDERQVVWLAICQGYSHESTSTALRTPLGTVKTRLRRALVRMRAFLEQQRAAAPNLSRPLVTGGIRR